MLNVFEAFAGVGAQRMALRNIGVNHFVVGISEIDKFALRSYEAIHGECPNLGDISKLNIDQIPSHDLFTYSFPCQDISLAGDVKGLSEGSGTRSSLLWECKRIIEEKRPKYLLLENVKNLVGKQNKPDFEKWLNWLERQGYTNYWKIVNANTSGIPQNRERVIVVSILGNHRRPFMFPGAEPLRFTLKDLANGFEVKGCTTRGRKNEEGKYIQKLEIRKDEFANCLTTKEKSSMLYFPSNGTYRKLTPREAWLLMGFTEEDYERAAKVTSPSQMYKQAGNSIVVPVLEGIFENLFL